ncbi:chondrolectin-like [Sinocyclocheilus rhinocerous]|uniref:chondrolectin-like n=1 Tax=Sinocyclocheilus rhinocerous TaxID=307959 RepID=UPI0007B9646B|nr:PREDICTED: chondrolectin-like [Sinocyclocheilus rhinocerous]
MEFMKLIGTVLAVCFHPCCASSAFGDHRICRRGTEKPCYKITSFQDSRLRASFEAARQKCREDDGELLSIETENEQRLVERFVQELRASDGDFWIGLGRSSQYNADCSSQYYWLDYSQGTFRNWLVTEPSCGLDQCVALFYRPSSSSGQKERKEQNEIYAVPGQWVRPIAPKSQKDYERTDKFNQSGAHLEYMSSEINRTFSMPSANSQFEDYKNVLSRPTQCGFVTNDIYETCRGSSAVEAGWVDNDIYGY